MTMEEVIRQAKANMENATRLNEQFAVVHSQILQGAMDLTQHNMEALANHASALSKAFKESQEILVRTLEAWTKDRAWRNYGV